ncbi:MAG TPA: POTRA domain-containing protein [Pyrinomonadaceae bacterium]|jgi:outer membrane protein assembly factor BamA
MRRSRKAFGAIFAAAPLCVAFVCVAARAAPVAAQAAQGGPAAKHDAPPAGGAASVSWRDVRVEFEGNRVFGAGELSATAAECYERARDAGREFAPDLLAYCLRTDVRRLLLRAGYVRAVVGEPKSEAWGLSQRITARVEEHERYRLGEVRIEGARHFEDARLRGLLALDRGEVADADAVTRWLRETLKGLYADEGFIRFDYDVVPEFRLDPGADEGVVDFAVTIDEGRRFRLRRLSLALDGDAPAEALRDAVLLREGDVYSAGKFAQTVEALGRLGLFEPIDAFADSDFLTDEGAGELEITINLTEKGRGRPAARRGAGRPAKPRVIRGH